MRPMYSDSAVSLSIEQAVNWIAVALTGTVATIIAVLATAMLGVVMLTGRLPARRSAEVIIGCFVLFSARLIAGALLGIVPPTSDEPVPIASVQAPYLPTDPKPVPYDPYAGASVPHADQDRPIIR